MIIERLRTCGEEDLFYCAVEFSLDSASALMVLRCPVSLGNNLELDTALAFPQRDRGHAFHLRGGHKPTAVEESWASFGGVCFLAWGERSTRT